MTRRWSTGSSAATDGAEALRKLASEAFDAIFLDVRMPDLDGVELARVLRRFAAPPQLVFVTAYDNAAVDAFELHALDYLLKPVGRVRLQEALERVDSAISAPARNGEGKPEPSAPSPAGAAESEIVAVANARSPGSTRLISRSSILYAQSHGDFVRIVVEDGRYLLRNTLTDLERRWEPLRIRPRTPPVPGEPQPSRRADPQFGGTALLSFGDERTIPVARRHVRLSSSAGSRFSRGLAGGLLRVVRRRRSPPSPAP